MKNKWIDVLGDKKFSHIIISKGNRVQVMVHPTKKQLRTRGKRGWSLIEAVDISNEQAAQAFSATVMAAIREVKV